MLVAPLLHNKDPDTPLASSSELPHVFVTITVGARGIVLGDAIPLPAALVQPPAVWVTVYVPPVITVIDEPVSRVLHNKFEPDVLSTEFPQLSVTVTAGAEGINFGAATAVAGKLVEPFTVCVTV